MVASAPGTMDANPFAEAMMPVDSKNNDDDEPERISGIVSNTYHGGEPSDRNSINDAFDTVVQHRGPGAISTGTARGDDDNGDIADEDDPNGHHQMDHLSYMADKEALDAQKGKDADSDMV